MFKKFILGLILSLVLVTNGFTQAESPLAPTVVNKTLTSSGTEYSVTLPNGAGALTVQSRTAADFKMATTSGASGTTYFTVKSGTAYYETRISSYKDVTLYFQSANAGQVIEIIYWQ